MGKRKEQLNLLCDIGDLAALLSESVDIEIFLQRTVRLVAGNLNADVCSVYLYDEQADELVLRATMGLNSEAVGKVRMKLGEGLVGITLERLQPICEGTATMSPYYRYFEEAHEDRFQSFLAVPIRRGVEKIGVLVVQKEQKNYFDEYDVMTLRATASQLAGAMENAKLLIGMNQPRGKKPDQPAQYKGVRFIKGKSASGGYAYADAAVMRESHGGLMTGYDESENGTTFTLKDFFVALEKTTQQLESLQAKLSKRLPESASLIFTAHFMILKDAKFIDKIVGFIEKGMPAPEAIRKVAGDYMRIFLSSPHAYIREKGNDMEDLAGRILKKPSLRHRRRDRKRTRTHHHRAGPVSLRDAQAGHRRRQRHHPGVRRGHLARGDPVALHENSSDHRRTPGPAGNTRRRSHHTRRGHRKHFHMPVGKDRGAV